jgi:hypothetical protein
MATRNLTMVVNKKHYEAFTLSMMDITPSTMAEYSKVNMYLHHDGYPEWQGVQLANWMKVNSRQDGSALAAKLVFDHYYDSCYLYNNPDEIDHQYTYIIFYDGDDPLIFCYDVWASRKVFCYTPQQILDKYTDEMDYTDFAAGEIRNDRNTESNKVNLSLDNVEKAMSALLICNNILKKSITD